MHHRKIKKNRFHVKNTPQAKFLIKQNAPQAKRIKQSALHTRFVD